MINAPPPSAKDYGFQQKRPRSASLINSTNPKNCLTIWFIISGAKAIRRLIIASDRNEWITNGMKLAPLIFPFYAHEQLCWRSRLCRSIYLPARPQNTRRAVVSVGGGVKINPIVVYFHGPVNRRGGSTSLTRRPMKFPGRSGGGPAYRRTQAKNQHPPTSSFFMFW